MTDDRDIASRFTGLATRLGPLAPRAHDPEVAVWAAAIARCGPRREEAPVGAAGWTDEAARDACVGEVVERYQPYPLRSDVSVEASYDRWPLDESAIEPDRWVLFHAEQYAAPGFPFRPLARDTVCRWACLRDARSGLPAWVPEELAYLYPRDGTEHRTGPTISTGLSAGRAGDPVVMRGLQETIERDALMGAWWGAYPLEAWPREVVALGEEIERRVLRPNLAYRFYRVATPLAAHVTVVTVEGEDREGFCFSAGAACRETRRASWLKALVEAVQGRTYARYLKGRLANPTSPTEVTDFPDHAVYYSLHPAELARTVLRRASSPREDGGAAIDEGLDALVERLGAHRPVLVRLMTPPAISGWVVVKVVVPGLQPMHGNHGFPYLGGPLWAPRGLAAWRAIPPHPFP
jgi:ribosomal protein S12 methylthiotransferase accessory factor